MASLTDLSIFKESLPRCNDADHSKCAAINCRAFGNINVLIDNNFVVSNNCRFHCLSQAILGILVIPKGVMCFAPRKWFAIRKNPQFQNDAC